MMNDETGINGVDTNKNIKNKENNDMIIHIQRFTASSISMLELLRSTIVKLNDTNNLDKKKSFDKFISSSKQYIDNLKDENDVFDYTRFIKKAFSTLRNETQCKNLLEKNAELFNMRDPEGKIITILPGIDIRFAYKFLDDNEKIMFWQYMYLFSSSVFNMIKVNNEAKFTKYSYITETLTSIETDMGKTGIMFKNQIFNPFIGVGENRNAYSLNEMFTEGELPKQQSISIESVLNVLGVDKMFDEKKLNEELKGIGDDQINEATERIVGLMGAADNPEVKEVCNLLIQDIVSNFKENGISNVSETLRKVAENAKNTIDINKMQKTAKSMKFFMDNSQEKMKDLKDANGNPIGQQLMKNMAIPLSMMNFMTRGQEQGQKQAQKQSQKHAQ